MELIALIAKQELVIALRTQRALVFAALYLVAALLGGLGYVNAVRLIEQQAMSLLMERGADADKAAQVFSLAGQEAYQKLLGFFAGTPPSIQRCVTG